MCLAIYKPKGKLVSYSALEAGFKKNSDGAGFAYNMGGKLIVQKGFFKFDEFIKAYEPHANRQMVIHFRWATHGEKNQFNCHPWLIEVGDWQMATIHNGILHVESTEQMSDTGHFVHGWLEPLLKNHSKKLWQEAGFKMMAEDFIGAGNKLVMLDSHGNYEIYNEKAGTWDEGVWYSNSDYKGNQYGRRYFMDDDMDGRAWGWEDSKRGNCTPCSGAYDMNAWSSRDLEVKESMTQAEMTTLDEIAEDEEKKQELFLLEDYLADLESEEPTLFEVANMEIARCEANGMPRLEALNHVLNDY